MQHKSIDHMQVKLIHIAKNKLGLSDEEYRNLLMERYPACFGSCKDLSYDEATDLIDHFKAQGFKIKKRDSGQAGMTRKNTAPNIIQLPSPQQMQKIEHLRADIKWHVHDGYNRWLKKYLKKERIATSREANNVIEALKGMLKRQEERGKGSEGQSEGVHLRHDGGMYGGYYQW